jgi:hypothetical protein
VHKKGEKGKEDTKEEDVVEGEVVKEGEKEEAKK